MKYCKRDRNLFAKQLNKTNEYIEEKCEQDLQLSEQISHKNLIENNSSLNENKNLGDAIIMLEEKLENQEETSESVTNPKRGGIIENF